MKTLFGLISVFIFYSNLFAQPGAIISKKRITNTIQLFGSNKIYLGGRLTSLGDLDKNGTPDFLAAVSDDGGNYRTSFYILFYDRSMNIIKSTMFAPGVNGFPLTPGFSYTAFGSNTFLGDLDNDGSVEIAIGNYNDIGGLIYIVSINPNGLINKVSTIESGDLNPNGNSTFGYYPTALKDIDGDGVVDLAVGAPGDKDGGNGSSKGAIYIIFLNAGGDMKGYQKISAVQGGFYGNFYYQFGSFINSVGDLNQDSINDIVVEAGNNIGDIEHWILFLNKNGTVKEYQKLAQDSGNFDFTFNPAIANTRPRNAGDINGDGINDLFMTFLFDTINGKACGSSRLLFLDTTGKVKSSIPVDYSSFIADLADGDRAEVVDAGFDFNGDYKNDFILGVPSNDFGGTNKGVFYMVSMDGAIHPVQPQSRFTAKDTTGLTTKTFTFTNTSSGYPKQVKWSFTPNTVAYQNGTSETSLDSVQVKFTNAGTYSVQLWVQNPFGQDSLLKTNHIVVNPIGGFEELRSNPFSVYPVPATTTLMVSGGEDLSGAVTLSIQNCLGETLSTETRLFTSNIPQVLNTSELPQGLYLLSISHNNVSYTLKFVK